MASRFPITRFSVTTGSRVIRRNFATEAVPEGFVSRRKGVEEHAKSTASLWKKISLYVCPIALLASFGNAYSIMKHHEAHNLEHSHEVTDHPHFNYQKIRSKPFFWGDGDHTLFHNPAINGP